MSGAIEWWTCIPVQSVLNPDECSSTRSYCEEHSIFTYLCSCLTDNSESRIHQSPRD
ncbi:hypothetical protein BD408DRAFT_426486, partial [Parasitella parasitica]